MAVGSQRPGQRSTKAAMCRQFRVLTQPRYVLAIVIGIVVSFMVTTWFFFPDPKGLSARTHRVRHSFTSDERAALEKQIRNEEQRRHEMELEALYSELESKVADASVNLELEKSKPKEQQDQKRIKELEKQISESKSEMKSKADKLRNDFESSLEFVVSERLREEEDKLVEEGADVTLRWFCDVVQDSVVEWTGPFETEGITPVWEAPIDFGRQPCIGVASENDPAVAVRIYYTDNRRVAARTAAQALASLNTTIPALKGAALRSAEYDPSNLDGCCNRVFFAVHPVFGAFYKLRLPLAQGGYRTVCYRRRWISKPILKPMTPYSKLDHLFDLKSLPEPIAVPAQGRQLGPVRQLTEAPAPNDEDTAARTAVLRSTRREEASQPHIFTSFQSGPSAQPADSRPAQDRVLEDNTNKKSGVNPAAQFARTQVYTVLPFRARHLGNFPALIKSLAGVKGAREAAAAPRASLHLLVAPVETHDPELGDVMPRVQTAIEQARATLGIDVQLVDMSGMTDDAMSAKAVVDWAKEISVGTRQGQGQTDDKGQDDDAASVTNEQAKKNAVSQGGDQRSRSLKEEAAQPKATGASAKAPTPASLITPAFLRTPFAKALVAALKKVPGPRVNVLLLDSATVAVPTNLARKTSWRVLQGRQVYAPIASAELVFDDDALYMDDPSANPDAGGIADKDAGPEAPFKTEAFWKKPLAKQVDEAEEKSILEADGRKRQLRSEPSSSSCASCNRAAKRRHARAVSEADAAHAEEAYRTAASKIAGQRRRMQEAGPVPEENTAPPAGDNLFDDDREFALDGYYDDLYDVVGDDVAFRFLDDDMGYGLGYEEFGGNYGLDDDAADLWGGDLYDDDALMAGGGHYFTYYDDFVDDDLSSLLWGDDDVADEITPLWTGLVDIDPQFSRLTYLGAAKSDFGAALFRAILGAQPDDGSPATRDRQRRMQEFESPLVGDECLLRRFFFVFNRRNYRVVRTVVPGLHVVPPSREVVRAGGLPPAEVEPCECTQPSREQFCQFHLPHTSVDDPHDEERVNCALTQVYAMRKRALPTPTKTAEEQESGSTASKDAQVGFEEVHFSQLVFVTHVTRSVDPSRGVELVAKLARRPEQSAAEDAKTEKEKEESLRQAASVPVEVFSFRFGLTAKAVPLTEEDLEEEEEGGFFW